MKNKRIILTFLFLLFATAGLFAQAVKKDEIRVPKEALLPRLTLDDVNKKLDGYFKWLEDTNLPATGKAFDQTFSTSTASPGVVRQHLMELRTLATDPDLEEVTKLPRSWYEDMFNASLPLLKASDIFLNVHHLCIEKNYQKGKQMWYSAVDELIRIRKEIPKKLSKEVLLAIAEKNQERRKREYIRLYKAQQAAALKKAKENAAAAASGQTKKKPKKKPKNKENSAE